MKKEKQVFKLGWVY